MPHTAYVALGSNLGDRNQNLTRAVEFLSAVDDCTVTARSQPQVYPAQGGRPGQPDYLNAVIGLTTRLDPFALQAALQSIEERMGRPGAHNRLANQDRVIDLDLLLYDQVVIVTPQLVVPHPRMHRRIFVLEPLCEVAPAVPHPALGLTAEQLLERLRAGPKDAPGLAATAGRETVKNKNRGKAR